VDGFSLEPDSVRVRGRRAAVRAIQGVSTARLDIRVRDTVPVVVDLDTSGLGVRVSPPRVRLRAQVVPDTAGRSTPRPRSVAPTPARATRAAP
jgi:hypothetical protein